MNQEKEIKEIRLDEIIPNRFQPRLTFNEEELNELSNSIKMHGIIQPLVLRRVNDKYEIIAGERRYKASQLAGLQTVPAVIMNLDDNESAEVALVENLQRKDLTAIEEAQSYKKILDMGYVTQEELASRMGVSQSTIANKLRLLNLTIPVKDALLNNKISERHARSLLNLTNNDQQIELLNKIINERLTVKQTDEEINKILGKTPSENVNSFDVDVDKIKTISEDIIKEPVLSDIDMLLRPETPKAVTEEASEQLVSEINTESSFNAFDNEVAINPFEETEPEIMNFEFENPVKEETGPIPVNDIIKEYRNEQQEEIKEEAMPVVNNESKNLREAISSAREQSRKIEQMGFEVDTEEFDFEDMYQIIIKIKKD